MNKNKKTNNNIKMIMMMKNKTISITRKKNKNKIITIFSSVIKSPVRPSIKNFKNSTTNPMKTK